MRNIDRCSCGCGEADTEIPGTPGPDGEDFVDNDYLFATEDSPEWYDEDEHARRRYVQPDPEINENVYSVSEEACREEQCSEPCEEPPDCGDACDCGTGESCDCCDVCENCGCPERSAPTQRRNGGRNCFDARKAREESIRRNHARAAQRRKALQDTVDADERVRRRENAMKQETCRENCCAEGQEPELSCLPEDLYVSPVEMGNMEPAPCENTAAVSCKKEKTWPEIPVFDLGPVCDFSEEPCIGGQPQPPACTEAPAQEDFVSPREFEQGGFEKAVPPPQPYGDYDIYEKAERFAQDDMTNCGCVPDGDGDSGNGNDGGAGEGCECCCKGEDCYAPDYYACELDEDCCNPESAFYMQGSFGDEVRKIQRCIKNIPEEQGGTPALEVDGIYGPNTAMAVMRFQEQHDIPADGVTNKKTRARMQRLCPNCSF